jgi:hypothetical protein
MLPFDLKISESSYPSLAIADIEVPAYGSVTPNETIAYNAIVASDSDPSLFHFDVICMFIASRLEDDYSLEDAKIALGDTPTHYLAAAFEWVKKEFSNWKDFDLDAEKKTQSQIGQESSGDSNSDTLIAIDSAPEALETAQST